MSGEALARAAKRMNERCEGEKKRLVDKVKSHKSQQNLTSQIETG